MKTLSHNFSLKKEYLSFNEMYMNAVHFCWWNLPLSKQNSASTRIYNLSLHHANVLLMKCMNAVHFVDGALSKQHSASTRICNLSLNIWSLTFFEAKTITKKETFNLRRHYSTYRPVELFLWKQTTSCETTYKSIICIT